MSNYTVAQLLTDILSSRRLRAKWKNENSWMVDFSIEAFDAHECQFKLDVSSSCPYPVMMFGLDGLIDSAENSYSYPNPERAEKLKAIKKQLEELGDMA